MLAFLSSEAVLAGIALFVGYFFYNKNKRDSRYPPGPCSIPFMGNVLQLQKNPLQVLQKWAEEYGSIYSIKMGTQDTVIINDPKLAKELFSSINSTGRAFNPVTYYFGHGNGIANAQGQIWESQRTFTVKKLREFCSLKNSNQGYLFVEVTALMKYFELQVGKAMPGIESFSRPVMNVLWRLVTGDSCTRDSEIKPEVLEKAESVVKSLNRASLLFFAPYLRHIAPNYFGWSGWTSAVNSFSGLVEKTVRNHSNNFIPNNPQGLIDNYLVKIQETTDHTSSFYKENGAKNLEAVVGDIFLAGSESTSFTLSFATLYLILNKNVQRYAQEELDRVIDLSCQVSLRDKPSLPYIEAVILETLRLSSIAPLGFPHRMLTDTMFHGYHIPKDVTVMAGLYTIHHDPKIWGEDANEFRPERFLNETKTGVIHHEALMAFSTGRRVCLGEGLARDTIFLFLANILQRFNIEPDPEYPVTKIETLAGFAVEPKPFKFVLSLRN